MSRKHCKMAKSLLQPACIWSEWTINFTGVIDMLGNLLKNLNLKKPLELEENLQNIHLGNDTYHFKLTIFNKSNKFLAPEGDNAWSISFQQTIFCLLFHID